MGLFDGIAGAGATPGLNNPTTPGGNFVQPLSSGVAAPTAGGFNPMMIASVLGMMGGAIGGPNSWQGRLGAGTQQVANGQLMAQAQLEREKDQRKFLSKLLESHNALSQPAGAGVSGMTPNDLSVSSYMNPSVK